MPCLIARWNILSDEWYHGFAPITISYSSQQGKPQLRFGQLRPVFCWMPLRTVSGWIGSQQGPMSKQMPFSQYVYIIWAWFSPCVFSCVTRWGGVLKGTCLASIPIQRCHLQFICAHLPDIPKPVCYIKQRLKKGMLRFNGRLLFKDVFWHSVTELALHIFLFCSLCTFWNVFVFFLVDFYVPLMQTGIEILCTQYEIAIRSVTAIQAI